MSDRALILPGLVPLTADEVSAVLRQRDDLLDAAQVAAGFEARDLPNGVGSDALLPIVHEVLLSVALLRVVRSGRWTAFGGLSSGFPVALVAAGVLTPDAGLRWAVELTTRQLLGSALCDTGSTLALVPQDAAAARRATSILRAMGQDPRLAVDLGSDLIAISVRGHDLTDAGRALASGGVAVLAEASRPEHCGYTAPARDEVQALAEALHLQPCRAGVVNPVTGRLVGADPVDVRHALVDQWFATADLPAVVDGLARITGVTAIDVAAPTRCPYVSQVRHLTLAPERRRLAIDHQHHPIAT